MRELYDDCVDIFHASFHEMIYIRTVYLLYTFDEINNILEKTCKRQQNSAYLLFTFCRSLHRINSTRNSLPANSVFTNGYSGTTVT